MKIFAHPGASGEAPENTLAAIELAWAQGADGIEVDLRLSADRALVALHDADTRRVAGIDRLVRHLSLTDLSKLDVGRWKGARWRGQTIPSLQAILDSLPPDKLLLIELKDGLEMLPPLERVFVSRNDKIERFYFMSFDFEILHHIKSNHPDWPALLLVAKPSQSADRVIKCLIKKAFSAQLDGLGLSHLWLDYTSAVIQARETGLLLSVWTVNNPDEAALWRTLGAQFLTTDYPDRMLFS